MTGAAYWRSLRCRAERAERWLNIFGGDPADLTSFYVLANYQTNRSRTLASKAALFVAGQLGWPWKAAVIARVLPDAVLDRAYDVIARSRYRVFGRFEQCLPPRPEFRGRFVE